MVIPPKKTLVLFIGLFLLGLMVLWLYTRPAAEKAEPGNDRFGLDFISPPDDLAGEARFEGALNSGARWDRWPLYWQWVAAGGYTGPHTDGQHDYDALVAQEIERGITPLVILMGTPEDEARPVIPEAAPAPAPLEGPLKSNPLEVSAATLPPASLYEPIFSDGSDEMGVHKSINPANAWARFVYATVNRYRPGGVLARQQKWPPGIGVRHWEIWNEPDFKQFWAGTVEEYARLLEVAYKTIKTADPEATVLLGGLAFYQQPNWLGQLLQQSQGDPARVYFDALSMHHYWSIYNSEARLMDIRAALEGYHLTDRPIWITESGLSVWDDYPATAHEVKADTPWRGTKAEQAAYVLEHSALTLYQGVERYFHFMLHDDCGDGPSTAFGLRQNFSPHVCSPAQGQPRPAYAAYQLAAEQFRDVTPLWRQRTNGQDQIAFYRPSDQTRVWVGWSTQAATATLTLTATGESAQLYWVDPLNATQVISTLTPVDGFYHLSLPPATNRNNPDPLDPRYHIGGQPYLLIERDTLPPTATITSLFPLAEASYRVKWQGQDLGSGIESYEVWAGRDDEAMALWLADTPQTEANFVGEAGHTYRFATRARDNAGNEGSTPAQAQASTQALSVMTLTGQVLGPKGEAVDGAVVTLKGADIERQVTTGADGRWSAIPIVPSDYTLEASAAGYGSWPSPREVRLEADSDVLLTLSPLENALRSGDFEGQEVWQHWAWAGQVDLFFQGFDGQFAARLGEGKGEEIACPGGKKGQRWAIQQPVDLPDEDEVTLSFVHKITVPDSAADEAWLEVSLLAPDGATHALIPPGEVGEASDWALTSRDVSAWRGQPVEVKVQVVRCSAQPFTVTMDRVSVGP